MFQTRRRAVCCLVVSAVFVWLLAVPVCAQTDGVIRGQLVTAADGSALSGASMTLVASAAEAPRETSTDATGRFVFAGVAPGKYVLTAAAPGLAAREAIVVLEPREVRTVTLALDLEPLAVSIEVAADADSVPGTHSPSSTLVSSERLGALPVTQRTNLPDALVTMAPGMIRGHDDLVHIRGHEVALHPLVNGVAFWENPHAIFSGGLSPEVIETANVMTGGFPAEYGNRFGGVVDIVTKSGFRMRDRGSVTLGAGEARRYTGSAELGGSRGGFGYYLFGSAVGSGRFLSPPDTQAIHDEARAGRAFAQLEGRLGDAGTLRTVLAVDGADFEIPRTPLDVELRPASRPEQQSRQQTVIAGWTQARQTALLSASAYQRWSRTRLLPGEGPLTATARLERELVTLGGKVDITRATGRHTWKAGLDAVRLTPSEDLTYDYAGYRELTHLLGLPHIHITGNVIAFSGRGAGGQVSAYAQDSIQLASRVTADVGLRLDHHGMVTSAIHASPRVNLAVAASDGAVVHASYNRFFVPPPIEGVLSNGAGLTRFINEIGTPLPALDPTVEDQAELGITARLRPIRLGVTGYVRASDNPVHTTVWPDSRIYSYVSFDRARAYGLEMRVDAPGLARYGVSTSASYAIGRVNFYNPITGGFTTEADHVGDTSRFPGPMDQRHTTTGSVTYDHRATGVRVGAAIEYGSGTPIGHGGSDHEHEDGPSGHSHGSAVQGARRVPGHLTANLFLAIELLRDANRRQRLSVRVDVENATNDIYLIAQESEFSPTQYSIPRLLSLTVKYRF